MLDEACRLILEEIILSPSAIAGKVEYRLTLLVSFFFRFYLEVLQGLKNKYPKDYLSALGEFSEKPPKGMQIYQHFKEKIAQIRHELDSTVDMIPEWEASRAPSGPSLLDELQLLRPEEVDKMLGMRVVAGQLQAFLEETDYLDPFHSGFRPSYGTESALVSLYDDLCRERDRGNMSLLVLLDLSAACNIIDHGILLDWLAGLGAGGTAWQWFCPYLASQFQKVVLGDYSSAPWELCHGVPQGSILSPVLFDIYMKPLGEVIRRFELRTHQYTDVTQLYLLFTSNPGEAVDVLNQCLAEVMGWMRANKLRLKPNKMEVLLVSGSGFQDLDPHQPAQDPVGRPIMHRSGIKHATGEAVYVDDIAPADGQLYMAVAVVTSPRAHAKILSIDVSEALKEPGVVAVVTADDIPGKNGDGKEEVFGEDEGTPSLPPTPDLSPVQRPAGSDTLGIFARKMNEKSFPVFQEAIRHNSFLSEEKNIEKGNVSSAFRNTENITEGELHVGGQEHFYLETNSVFVIPRKEDNNMDVYVSTQDPAKVQMFHPTGSCAIQDELEELLGGRQQSLHFLPQQQQRLHAVYIYPLRIGCPVRFILERDDDMLILGNRHPLLGKYKT
ncbi:Aldehyde oxidase 2 [Varanus komodoensis]|nr:Aldehyde oxidase 2 [Varanus komodoensis]